MQGEGKAPRASHLLCASSPWERISHKHHNPGKKDWISLLKKNRNLETNSFILKDAAGYPEGCDSPNDLKEMNNADCSGRVFLIYWQVS